MGGRGSDSGIKYGAVSSGAARIAFNSAKKSTNRNNSKMAKDRQIEKAIATGNGAFLDSVKSEKEARRISDYLTGRVGQFNHQVASLGDSEKLRNNPKLYRQRMNAISLSNLASQKAAILRDTSDIGRRNTEVKNTTTTYDRARSRRIKNFDSWFYGK